MAEKEEKTKKALVYARQKIAQVTGKRASLLYSSVLLLM